MTNDVIVPSWLTTVSQAPEHDPWLRLMMLNPVNNEVSVFINRIIDLDGVPPQRPDYFPQVFTPPPEP